MSISDTGSTSSSSSSSSSQMDFNFNAWINQNNFEQIRSLFIQHKMFSPSDLHMDSSKFGPFVADVIVKDPQFASSIVTAFTNLHKPPIQKIRATDEEFEVEDLIDKKLHKLNKMKYKIDELRNQFKNNKKTESDTINEIETKIDNEFNQILMDIKRYKNTLKNNLDEFSMYKEENLENKIVVLAGLTNEIKNVIENTKQDLNNVQTLLDNNKIDRNERKHKILSIGKECEIISCESYENELHTHHLYDGDNKTISCIINSGSKNKIAKYTRKFMKLECNFDFNFNENNITDQFEGKCNDNYINNNNVISSGQCSKNGKLNDEIIVLRDEMKRKESSIDTLTNERDKLKQNVLELNTKIEDLNGKFSQLMGNFTQRNKIIATKDSKITELETKLNTFNKELNNKKGQIEIMNEKYNRIKKENQELQNRVNNNRFTDEKKYGQLKNENQILKQKLMDKTGQLSKNETNFKKIIDAKNGLQKLLDERNGNCDQLQTEKRRLNQEIETFERKLEKKRNKIMKLERQISENEGNNNGTCDGKEWEDEMNKCMVENDRLNDKNSRLKNEMKELKSEVKEYIGQIKILQRKLKNANGAKDEIHKLRKVCNDLRNECNQYKNKLNDSKNESWAGRLKICKREQYGKFVKKLERFNGNNGKEFVGKFCRILGKNVKEEAAIKRVNKDGEKMWYCVIKLNGVGIVEEMYCKQKKGAMGGCYKKVADIIEGWRK